MAYKKYSRRKRKTKGRTRKMKGRSRKMRGGEYRCSFGKNNKDSCEQLGISLWDSSQKCQYNDDNSCTAYVKMTKELALVNIKYYQNGIRVLQESFQNKNNDPEYIKLVERHGNKHDISNYKANLKILEDKLLKAEKIYESF